MQWRGEAKRHEELKVRGLVINYSTKNINYYYMAFRIQQVTG